MSGKFTKILKCLEDVPGLSEDEKVLHAKGLAATPQERWQMNRAFLRSLGLLTRSELKKRASY